jgi:hypothetical protein
MEADVKRLGQTLKLAAGALWDESVEILERFRDLRAVERQKSCVIRQ